MRGLVGWTHGMVVRYGAGKEEEGGEMAMVPRGVGQVH